MSGGGAGQNGGVSEIGRWARAGAVASGQGLVVAALTLVANTVLFALAVTALALIPAAGFGFAMFPLVTAMVRVNTGLQRRLAGWSGPVIGSAYRPLPPAAAFGTWSRFRAVVSDPATWLDLAWLVPGAVTGGVCGLVAFSVPLYGLEGVLLVPIAVVRAVGWYGYGVFWPLHGPVEQVLVPVQGVFILVAGLAAARWMMWLHFRFAGLFLAPVPSARLTERVHELTATRADVVDAQAAELRRIERDLHDGAQARLVSLGMTIGLAEELLADDPDAARLLLAEARESSGRALVELRDLVRGIHPPVLAERGLTGAVQALALRLPLPATVQADLDGRPPAPVESAAYFAVAEILANLTKHSGARTAGITLHHADGRLTIVVRDDGSGGADPRAGTGLRGIQRRVAAFDGTMVISSPIGGPTVVTVEVPCALSSPRTSPSSATDSPGC